MYICNTWVKRVARQKEPDIDDLARPTHSSNVASLSAGELQEHEQLVHWLGSGMHMKPCGQEPPCATGSGTGRHALPR